MIALSISPRFSLLFKDSRAPILNNAMFAVLCFRYQHLIRWKRRTLIFSMRFLAGPSVFSKFGQLLTTFLWNPSAASFFSWWGQRLFNFFCRWLRSRAMSMNLPRRTYCMQKGWHKGMAWLSSISHSKIAARCLSPSSTTTPRCPRNLSPGEPPPFSMKNSFCTERMNEMEVIYFPHFIEAYFIKISGHPIRSLI